jgi:hypothetical protein
VEIEEPSKNMIKTLIDCKWPMIANSLFIAIFNLLNKEKDDL